MQQAHCHTSAIVITFLFCFVGVASFESASTLQALNTFGRSSILFCVGYLSYFDKFKDFTLKYYLKSTFLLVLEHFNMGMSMDSSVNN